MIRFGPVGIPLSSQGRTSKDGVLDTHMLGLSCMELQFLRVHTNERFASEEEVGTRIRDLENTLAIQVIREEEDGDMIIRDLDHVIEDGDILVTFSSPIAPTYSVLRDIGRVAKELDVSLSLSLPHHMNLCAPGEGAERSILWAVWGGMLAHAMDAPIVVSNIGTYHWSGKGASRKNLVGNIGSILKELKRQKIRIKLALQPSPKPEIFGTFDEILAVCRRFPGEVIPVLNFPNIHIRTGGFFKDKSDFKDIINRARPAYKKMPYYGQFSGVEYTPLGEIHYSPIKRGELKFEPFAEYLVDAAPEISIISISPLVEHDAMYMKQIYERIVMKREMKRRKQEAMRKAKKAKIPMKKKGGDRTRPSASKRKSTKKESKEIR